MHGPMNVKHEAIQPTYLSVCLSLSVSLCLSLWDFRLPPRYSWNLRSSRMLGRVGWLLFTDVSGRPIHPILNPSSPLKMGLICWPATSVNKYKHTLRNNPEDRKSYLFVLSSVTIRSQNVCFFLSSYSHQPPISQSFCLTAAVRFRILLQATIKSHTNGNSLLRIRSQAPEIKNEFIVTIRYVCYANSSAVDEKKGERILSILALLWNSWASEANFAYTAAVSVGGIIPREDHLWGSEACEFHLLCTTHTHR